MAKCGTFSLRLTKSEPCWLGEQRGRHGRWGRKDWLVSPSLKISPFAFFPQEDPGRITTDLPLHLQQCLRLHQVTQALWREAQGSSFVIEGPNYSLLSAFFLPSMETLSDMFELDLPTVHSIISKMIINEELMVRAISYGNWRAGVMESLVWRGLIYISLLPLPHSHQASLDQPTQTVVMHRTEPTAQQNLALQLAEKLGSLVENNERVFDHKQGTYGGYFRGEWLHSLCLPGSSHLSCLLPGIHPLPFPSLLQTRRMATAKMRATCAGVGTVSSSLRRPTDHFCSSWLRPFMS